MRGSPTASGGGDVGGYEAESIGAEILPQPDDRCPSAFPSPSFPMPKTQLKEVSGEDRLASPLLANPRIPSHFPLPPIYLPPPRSSPSPPSPHPSLHFHSLPHTLPPFHPPHHRHTPPYPPNPDRIQTTNQPPSRYMREALDRGRRGVAERVGGERGEGWMLGCGDEGDG